MSKVLEQIQGLGLHPEQQIVVVDGDRVHTGDVSYWDDHDVCFCGGFDIMESQDLVVLVLVYFDLTFDKRNEQKKVDE